jgi:hypothetical protein
MRFIVPWFVLAFAGAGTAFGAPDTFFGEDLHPGPDGDSGSPDFPHPIADAARAEFYSRLVNGVETEDFESQTTGTTPTFDLHFGPDTATIHGTAEVLDASYSGHHAVSGAKFLDIGHDADPKSFYIDFSSPQSAFGFYVTDLGDADAQILVTLHHPSGPDTEITPASLVADPAARASVLFFGVIDVDNPFDTVTISRVPSTATDGFAFDDMVIARAGSVVPLVDSFFLPKSVLFKPNAAAPSKGLFKTAGFFDTGSKAVDLTAGATLSVGTRDFVVPGLTASANGRTFTHSQGGLTFVVVKNPFGSSRAKFRLQYTGDLGTDVPTDGTVELRFHNDAVDGKCQVLLARGGYRLGRARGALSQPNLFVVRAHASVPGGGKDSFAVIVGLATSGSAPAGAQDVLVEFGLGISSTIPAGSFTRKGDAFVFKGDIGGVTSVTLDYARETIAIQGKGLDLGTFAQGQSPLRIVVGLGAENRGVAVRIARNGNLIKY